MSLVPPQVVGWAEQPAGVSLRMNGQVAVSGTMNSFGDAAEKHRRQDEDRPHHEREPVDDRLGAATASTMRRSRWRVGGGPWRALHGVVAEPGQSYVQRRRRSETDCSRMFGAPSQLTQPVGARLGETGQLFICDILLLALYCHSEFRRLSRRERSLLIIAFASSVGSTPFSTSSIAPQCRVEPKAAQAAIDLIEAQRFALIRPAILSSLSASASTALAIYGARTAMALPSSSLVVARIAMVCAAVV
jgi:hypothetical protein